MIALHFLVQEKLVVGIKGLTTAWKVTGGAGNLGWKRERGKRAHNISDTK